MATSLVERKIDQLERQVAALHSSLEARGVNSTGTADVYGRVFPVPVDEEHKAKLLFTTLCKGIRPILAQPHMYAFWASTLGFFVTLFSVFAPAALMPYIRRSPGEGGIGLSGPEIADSGSAAVGGTIVMRIIAGPLCDVFGARKAFFLMLWLGIPGIIMLALSRSAGTFIAARLLTGLSLATFVTCQVWCSQMFSGSVVGAANATSAGWGNLGAAIAQLTMPFIMLGFLKMTGTHGDGANRAWRLCMIVPAALHVIASVLIMLGRDLPDGNYKALEATGIKEKARGGRRMRTGFSNVNAWILSITYGFCFGVELTMNNNAVLYYYRYCGVSPQLAGVLGACFGLTNLFARSFGGILSDVLNARCGMRGRLWACWVAQTIEGLMCLIVGLVTISMPSPDRKLCEDGSLCPTTDGDRMWGVWQTENPPVGLTSTYGVTYMYKINSTSTAHIMPCGSESIATPSHGWLIGQDGSETLMPMPTTADFIVVADLNNPLCVRNSANFTLIIFCMALFSIAVQMAEGLHFGIVPFVAPQALGVVSGMVGAGGNLGAVIGSKVIMAGDKATDLGFIHLGLSVMAMSVIMHFIYFPDSGSTLLRAGALGWYDPQLWKASTDNVRPEQPDYAKEAAGQGTMQETELGSMLDDACASAAEDAANINIARHVG